MRYPSWSVLLYAWRRVWDPHLLRVAEARADLLTALRYHYGVDLLGSRYVEE